MGLYKSMRKLIRENAAYADANEIICLYKRGLMGRRAARRLLKTK